MIIRAKIRPNGKARITSSAEASHEAATVRFITDWKSPCIDISPEP